MVKPFLRKNSSDDRRLNLGSIGQIKLTAWIEKCLRNTNSNILIVIHQCFFFHLLRLPLSLSLCKVYLQRLRVFSSIYDKRFELTFGCKEKLYINKQYLFRYSCTTSNYNYKAIIPTRLTAKEHQTITKSKPTIESQKKCNNQVIHKNLFWPIVPQAFI